MTAMTVEEQVLECVKSCGPISGADVATKMEKDGIPRTSIMAYLTQLFKQALVRRDGERRNYMYTASKSSAVRKTSSVKKEEKKPSKATKPKKSSKKR